jgi:hypothetical protein
MVGEHRDECLGQVIRAVEISMSRSDVGNLLSLLLIQLHRLTHIQKGGSCWGEAAFDAGCEDRIGGSTDFGSISRQFERGRGSRRPMLLAHARV